MNVTMAWARMLWSSDAVKHPSGGEPHPHNQAEVREVLRGPSNWRWIIEKCAAFFCFSFSLGFARNCGFGKILGAGFLEYLGRISG